MVLKALVIDDEPYARADFGELCRSDPRLQIVWEAGSMSQARQILSAFQPDVVFLDVQLQDGSGFDLVPRIPDVVQLVFVTAYDQYALRAFEVNALDYLLKPVSMERFQHCVERLLRQCSPQELPETPPSAVNYDDRVLIKHGAHREFVLVSQVIVVTSVGGNYTHVGTLGGSWFVVRRTIKEWEALLPPDQFARVHRASIVNLNHVERATRALGGGLRLKLRELKEPITVSRRLARSIDLVVRTA